MTVNDSQEDDTASAPGPDVKVGGNVNDGNEPEDSQQTPRPQRSRLPPPVFTYNALNQPTYFWPNIAAVQGGWYQLPVPPVIGQICLSLEQVLLCLEQINYHLNSLYAIQGHSLPINFCYATNSLLFRFQQW